MVDLEISFAGDSGKWFFSEGTAPDWATGLGGGSNRGEGGTKPETLLGGLGGCAGEGANGVRGGAGEPGIAFRFGLAPALVICVAELPTMGFGGELAILLPVGPVIAICSSCWRLDGPAECM